MKILTISASPFLITRLGRMNAAIIKHLKKSYDIGTAVWHHDDTYFMAGEDGRFIFDDDDGKEICEIFPFNPNPEMSTPQLYEVMKKFQPNIVISIGDYIESDCVAAIKSMYPNLFKWIAILTIGTDYINPGWKEALSYIDYALVTTDKGADKFGNLLQGAVPNCKASWGVDTNVFYQDGICGEDSFVVMNSSKNSQQSNLGVFVESFAKFKGSISTKNTKGVLHTNINDPGDYDIYNLLEMYNLKNDIILPDSFVSINEGFDDSVLRQLYSSCDVFVDCSVQSSTAMSMLEAMSCGAIPLGSPTGKIGEILKDYPVLPIEGVKFIGKNEENMFVCNSDSLGWTLLDIWNIKQHQSSYYRELRESSINIAKKYLQEDFLKKLTNVINNVCEDQKQILVVED